MTQGEDKPSWHICAESIRLISLRAIARLAGEDFRNVVVVHVFQSLHTGVNFNVCDGWDERLKKNKLENLNLF